MFLLSMLLFHVSFPCYFLIQTCGLNFFLFAVIEYVGPKYRTLVANMSFGIYFAIAASILPWVAYWIADWRILSVASAIPLLAAFVAPWTVPESARYEKTCLKII